jgi:hypothetical protein
METGFFITNESTENSRFNRRREVCVQSALSFFP